MLRKRSRSHQKDKNRHMGHHDSNANANSDHYSQFLALNTHQSHSIFNVPPPCLFVGLGPKSLLDADSVRSPTSPLDARVLSNLCNNHVRTPKSPSSSSSLSSHHNPHHDGNRHRSWDCCKVGLSIIDSLEDCSKLSGKILRCSESKNISLTPKMIIKAPNCDTCVVDSFESSKSLPKDFCKAPCNQNGPISQKGKSSVLFEIGDSDIDHELFGKTRSCSLDSCSPLKPLNGLTTSNNTNPNTDDFALKDVNVMTPQLSSPPHFIGGSKNSNTFKTSSELNSNTVSMCSSSEFVIKSLSASEIELSEDYTCVISRGPNPKTTHIFGDCILETHSNSNELKNHINNEGKEKKGVSLVENKLLHTPIHYPSREFLSFCHHCNKKLQEGKDIYIYRGERAFCSLTCRALEIMNDEEQEESNSPSEKPPKHEIGEQIFETGMLTST